MVLMNVFREVSRDSGYSPLLWQRVDTVNFNRGLVSKFQAKKDVIIQISIGTSYDNSKCDNTLGFAALFCLACSQDARRWPQARL